MVKRALIVAMLITIAAGLLAPALTQAQSGVTIRPNRDYINVRLWPAIGGDVIGSLEPDDVLTVTGRSVDEDWLRIDFHGDEGWVAVLVVDVFGDISTLPLADPRTIPYNSNTSPSAGGGSLPSTFTATLEDTGLFLRAGPSIAYPILANLPRYAMVSVSGRVESGRWVQVSWEDVIGWVATSHLTLQSSGGVSFFNLPVIPPSAETGVRLSDANARERFLIVDEIRRHLERADATWAVVEAQWYAFGVAGRPEICSAPPPLDDYYLTPYERHVQPDLDEAVIRLNQGLEDLRNAIQLWLDGCVPGYGGFTEEVIITGRTAVANAQIAFDDAAFRLNRSKPVLVIAIHAHHNYATDQLARIEAIWLDVRDGVIFDRSNAPCVAGVPQQPPDFALTPAESSAYPELIPLVNQLNTALASLRNSIQLWMAQCDVFQIDPYYIIPGENAAAGYNSMLAAHTEFNAVDTLLVQAYESGDYLSPAPTATPDPTIQAILHPPYTPTFTPSPTPSFQYQPTQSFLVASHIYQGCTWFGAAGQVVDRDGNPVLGALIHLTGGGQDVYVASGSNDRYGLSGWEIPVRLDAAQSNHYTVRIEDNYGNPLSAEVYFTFSSDCNLNTALLTFVRY